jgi:hypothetical protein
VYRGIYSLQTGHKADACKDFTLANNMGNAAAAGYLKENCK